MKILKYIINSEKVPIIFSTTILHCDLLVSVESAGFVIVTYDADTNRFLVKCFGESSSLKIRSKYSDEGIIEEFLNSQFL